MNCSILVLSCDSYKDVWKPFFLLKDKYWSNCQYKTYIATEIEDCEYCEAIKINENIWSNRIRKTLEQIPTDYVIICCEDMFIRDYVNQDIIKYTLKQFKDNIATFNFELCYENFKSDIWGYKLKEENSRWKNSCQFGLWNRKKLIENLNCEMNPWEWEELIVKDGYKYYINAGIPIIDYGYSKCWFGLCKGKWTQNAVDLMKKENIEIDFEKRGII